MKKNLRYLFLSLFLATSWPISELVAMYGIGSQDQIDANFELCEHLKENGNQLLAYSCLPVGSHNVAGQKVVVDQDGGVTVSKGTAQVTFTLQKILDNYVPTSEQISRWLKALDKKGKSRGISINDYIQIHHPLYPFKDPEYLKLANEPIQVEENGLIIRQHECEGDLEFKRVGKEASGRIDLKPLQIKADKKKLMEEIPTAKLCAWMQCLKAGSATEIKEGDYTVCLQHNKLAIQETKSGLSGKFSVNAISEAQMRDMICKITPEELLNVMDEKGEINGLDNGSVTIVGYKFTKNVGLNCLSIEAPAGVDGSVPYTFACGRYDLVKSAVKACVKQRMTPIEVVKLSQQKGLAIKIGNNDLKSVLSHDGAEITISLNDGTLPVHFRIKDAKRELILSRLDILAQIRAQTDNSMAEYDFGEGVKIQVTKAEGLLFFDGDNFFEMPLDSTGLKPVDPNKKTKNNWSKAELAAAGARFVALMVEQQLRRVYGADSKLVLASGIALDLCRIANDILFVAPEFKTAAGISTMPWVAVDLYDIVKKASKLLGSKKPTEKLEKDEVKALKFADKLITFFRAAAPTLEGVLALSRAGVKFSSSMNIQKIAPFAAVLLSVVRSLDMMANAGEDNIQKKLSYLMFGVSALGGIIEAVQYVRTPVAAN